jgi:hypothetical protein
MNPVKAIRIWRLIDKLWSLIEGKDAFMVKIPQLVHLLTTLFGVIGVPVLAQNWLLQPGHGTIYIVLVAVSVLLHTISPSIFGAPSDTATQQAGLSGKAGMILLCALLLGGMAPGRAQTVTPATPIQNFYAAGGSYNVGASPGIAGTGLYAHVIANSRTYAFTAVDALPNTKKPFTVTTNIGVGIAQQLATLGKVTVWIPSSAGISWSGSNSGWQWNSGAMATIPLKNSFYLAPIVRVLKSSVSGGTGYQPIIGLLFCWGK